METGIDWGRREPPLLRVGGGKEAGQGHVNGAQRVSVALWRVRPKAEGARGAPAERGADGSHAALGRVGVGGAWESRGREPATEVGA